MKAQQAIVYESPQPGYTIRTCRHSMYELLAMDLVQPRRRLVDCLREAGETEQEFYFSEREALMESLYDRVADILHARDEVALANARDQDGGTLHEIRYNLSSLIGSAAGLFDTIAVLVHSVLDLNLNPKAGDAAITLRRSEFRSGLRNAGAHRLADVAGRSAPLLDFVWGLRNPLFHREGLPGYTLHVLGGARQSQITLSHEHTSLLQALCGHRHEDPQDWGLDDRDIPGFGPSLEPFPFAHRLAIVVLGNVDQLVGAFAEDRDAPRLEAAWPRDQERIVRRFRWLSGLPGAGPLDRLAAGKP